MELHDNCFLMVGDLEAIKRDLSQVDVQQDMIRQNILGAKAPDGDERIIEEFLSEFLGLLDLAIQAESSGLLKGRYFRSLLDLHRDFKDKREIYENLNLNLENRQIHSRLDPVRKWMYEALNTVDLLNSFIESDLADSTNSSQDYYQLLQTARKSNEEISSILERAKNSAAEKTSIDYAVIFSEESKKHSSTWPLGSAQVWLIVSVIAVVCLLSYLILGLRAQSLLQVENGTELTTLMLVARIVSRVAVVSILSFILSFSIKQYGIHRHQAILNVTRHNALSSLELFQKAAHDEATKSAILTEVCRAIYSIQPSGYLRSGSDSSTTSIIELTKLMNKGSGGE